MSDDIRIRVEGHAGRITLARPGALNALTHDMIRAIDRALIDWAHDPSVRLVLIDAEGERAFCAGGDIAFVYHTGRAGDFDAARRFWREEYVVNARIARFPKTIVALMQGFVMGGGVGIGGHASRRVVGDTTRIAMPECMIGLVPDVGGSHLLAQAPGRLGEFLGLTGHRMGPGDAIVAGFADHYIPEAKWPELVAALVEGGDLGAISAAAEEPPSAPIADRRYVIDTSFAVDTLTAIRDSLPASDWGRETAALLEKQCALSMGATLRLVRAARDEPGIERALARELRFTWRSASEGELLEGIRAAVIDKDRAPKWRDTINTIRPERIDAMLAPLGEHELDLPDL
jgi:enoyl-CoA hydratase